MFVILSISLIFSGTASSSKESLGEGRNKADLYQQTQHRLGGSQSSKVVSQCHVLEKKNRP